MTTLVACAVRDSALDGFARPFFVPTAGVAIRSFTDEVNSARADNPMHNHADDFELWVIGSYDDVTGTFFTDDRRMLTRAKDVLVKADKPE